MSRSSIIFWSLFGLINIPILYFFGLGILFIAIPFVLPSLPNLIYGYFSRHSWFIRFMVALIIGALGGVLFAYLIGNFCGVDGGEPCAPDAYGMILSVIFGAITGIPLMLTGVLIRKIRKKV